MLKKLLVMMAVVSLSIPMLSKDAYALPACNCNACDTRACLCPVTCEEDTEGCPGNAHCCSATGSYTCGTYYAISKANNCGFSTTAVSGCGSGLTASYCSAVAVYPDAACSSGSPFSCSAASRTSSCSDNTVCGKCAGGADTCGTAACGDIYGCSPSPKVCNGLGTGASRCNTPDNAATCYCDAMCTGGYTCISNACTSPANAVNLYLNNTLNANKTYTYPQAINATGTSQSGTVYVYRDNVLKASGSSPQNEQILLGAGTYAYKVNATGNATGITWYAIVNQNTTNPVNIFFINSSGTYQNQNISVGSGTSTTANATTIYSSSGTVALWLDGVSVNNPNTTTLSIGLHSYKGNITGNANYSSNASGATFYINVYNSYPQWVVNSNSTNPTLRNTPISHNLQWTDYNGLSGYIFSWSNLSSCIPITIILNETNGGNIGDAYTYSYSTTYNTGKENTINVGYYGARPTIWRSFLLWDLSSIPAGATITNANMSLYDIRNDNQYILAYNTSPMNTTGTSYWNEGTLSTASCGSGVNCNLDHNITWDNQPSANILQDNQTNRTDGVGWWYWNATDASMITHANTTYPVMSIMLKDNVENVDKSESFYSKEHADTTKRPQLTITYLPNGCGSWYNDSWTSMVGTTNWSNATHTFTEPSGVDVSWKIFSNNTVNNWNTSDVFNYTLTKLACDYGGSGDWFININDNCTISSLNNVNGCIYIYGSNGWLNFQENQFAHCFYFNVTSGGVWFYNNYRWLY